MINLITVIIPFYNGERFYPLLLESIRGAILECTNNKIVNFEIITIIDSTDTILEGIEAINSSFFAGYDNIEYIVYKNNNNIGVAASRNKAISLSSGDYFHIIDQDDEITRHFYSEIATLLNRYNFFLNNGWVKYSNGKSNNHKLYYLKPNLSVKGIISGDYIRSPGQVLFSKRVMPKEFFPQPLNYKGADDRFFWMRIFVENQDVIKPYYNSRPNYVANIHGNNYSTDQLNLKRSELENWNIIRTNAIFDKFKKIIDKDILRIRLTTGEKLPIIDFLAATLLKWRYTFQVNKVLRFLLKLKK